MQTIFRILFVGLIAIAVAMVFFILHKKNLFDRLNALFSINTVIVLLIITVGFIDGRMDMYIDIAISYAILGFVTTIILAKYMGGRR